MCIQDFDEEKINTHLKQHSDVKGNITKPIKLNKQKKNIIVVEYFEAMLTHGCSIKMLNLWE